MMDFLRFIFSDFWIWLGFVIIVLTPLGLVYNTISRKIKAKTIRMCGWPPAHCDSDGDFKKDKKDER